MKIEGIWLPVVTPFKNGELDLESYERLLNHFINETRNSKRVNPDGKVRGIPCQMINCFCMYSDYTPLTLDEWIENDRLRREKENSETKKETF